MSGINTEKYKAYGDDVMPSIKQYEKFRNWLMENNTDYIELSFSEIEQIIGAKFTPTARKYDVWWSNHPSHPLTIQWLAAGYKAISHNLAEETVVLKKESNVDTSEISNCQKRNQAIKPLKHGKKPFKEIHTFLPLCFKGYLFKYIETIDPQRDNAGNIAEFFPQYQNGTSNLILSKYGEGAFCRFSINAENCSGVYLWVVEGEIIYIGETKNFQQRFNTGYGKISARNCYIGGQNTNCRMNKIVLEYYKKGKTIQIYFFKTEDYKQIELELLQCIKTKFNIKDN